MRVDALCCWLDLGGPGRALALPLPHAIVHPLGFAVLLEVVLALEAVVLVLALVWI